MSNLIGTTLGHYRLTALLGRGGMGEVYRARDTRLDRDVALKVLPTAMAADPARLERFEREAKTVASLNHPHIVHLYSVEEDAGVRFLTMELVEGQALDAMIPASGLPLTKVFDIGIAVADALAAAHDKGIVHDTRFRPWGHAGPPHYHRRHGDGHGALYVAGAAARPAGRLSQRHLLARCDAL
jgi:serine/threonine protein kinase